MKKWITGLGALLALQLILAVALNMGGNSYGAFKPEEKLANFEPVQLDKVQIETADKRLLLKKVDGQWQLPKLDSFPADQQKVEKLLDTLAGLKKGWPVATSSSAAQHFKVDEDLFERRITLGKGGDEVARLYFGTSPGLRKVHARIADEDEIVTVPFSLFKANANSNDWINKRILKLNESDITRAELPGLTLQRQDGQWQLTDLGPTEQMLANKAQTLINKLAGITLESVFTSSDKPELDKETPATKVSLMLKAGDTLGYIFSKLKGGGYLLQRSDQTRRFKVADWQVSPIKEAQRAQLVEAKTPDSKTAGESASESG